jgi:subtilisin family serine protease
MTDAAHRRSSRGRVGVAFAAALLGALGLVLGTPKPASAVPANGRAAWNFKQVEITRSVQEAGHDGRGVIVAVVDTWVDSSNKTEFGNRVLAGADCANHAGQCVPGPAKHDGCGHGTHVAGTVASTNWGVAPQATILPVRVLTDPDGQHPDECTGSTTDVAAGINWAAHHGARVINLSLAAVKGVATASPVTKAVQQAVNAGIVVVFAAGNSDRPVADAYGGRALIVAATGPSGGLASYSQHGLGVSVAAPGGDPKGSTCAADGSDCVVSTWLNKEYAALAGTSMSAPHVSGLAALLLSQHPGRSESNVVQMIEATAHPLQGAGNGRIDAAAALGVTPSGAPTHTPATHSAAPTHRATAQAVPGNGHGPATVRPAPPTKTTAKPGTTAAPKGPSLKVLSPSGSDEQKDLPVAPPLAAAALLVGLASGLVAVGRQSRT